MEEKSRTQLGGYDMNQVRDDGGWPRWERRGTDGPHILSTGESLTRKTNSAEGAVLETGA